MRTSFRSISARLLPRAVDVARYRGAEGDGAPLWLWLLALLVTTLAAFALSPALPPLVYLPLSLGVALALSLLAAARGAADRLPRGSKRAIEWSFLLIVLWVLGRRVFQKVLDGSAILDTGDHQVMMARAAQFAQGLSRGKWLYWTHWMQGGDSLTDLYPYFANLVTAAIHVLSPKGTSFASAYTGFVLFSWALRGAGAYYLARRFAGPLPSVLVAVASLLDVGTDVWDGVWKGALYWGMVHSAFALTLVQFPIALLVDVARTGNLRRGAIAAVLTAVCGLSHPLGSLAMAVVLCAFVLCALFRDGRRGLLVAVGFGAAGLGLSAFWALPFGHAMQTLSYSNAIGGFAMPEAARAILNGAAPSSSFGAWVGFTVLALCIALVGGDVTVSALALAALICWLVAFQTVTVEARLLDYFPGLLAGQQRRFLTVLKTLLVPGVAWTLALLARQVPAPTSLRVRAIAWRSLVALFLLLGPVRVAFSGLDALTLDMQGQITGKRGERSHAGADFEKVFRVVAKTRREDRNPTPWRVWVDWKSEWRHAAWAEGFALGVPVIDPITIPGNFLSLRPREYSLQGLADWNVRFVVTDYKTSPFPGLTKRESSGRFTLWEVERYDADFVAAPPGVRVTNLRLYDDTIEFDVSGAPQPVDLQVRVAWYPRWRAYGAASSLRAVPPHPGAKPRQDQLAVRARDGHVVLRCDGSMPRELLGWSVTLLSALGLVVATSGIGRKLSARTRDSLVIRSLRQRVSAFVTSIRERRLVTIAALSAAVAIALVFAGLRVGSRSVLPPPLFTGLLTVYGGAEGKLERCRVSWPLTIYDCKNADISATVGASAREHDSTSEYARLWPGTSVAFSEANSMVRLEYKRFKLDRSLPLDLQAFGAFDLKAYFDGELVAERKGAVSGPFELPKAKRATTGTLVLEIRAPGGGTLVFGGR